MQNSNQNDFIKALVKLSGYLMLIAAITVICIVFIIVLLLDNGQPNISPWATINNKIQLTVDATTPISVISNSTKNSDNTWKAPNTNTIPVGSTGEMIRYGRNLIAHTADYLGPRGSVAHISNGMNCQNCHLDGGSRLFGNNFAGFISSYPKMSNRSGRVGPASERLVECFVRSLGGTAPDTSKKEIKAMLAYMQWIGKNVKKGQKLFGSATEKIPYLPVAADPAKGKLIFASKCKSCHGSNGEGVIAANKKSYVYPPLWGAHSYNDGAGMYRIINLAGFVKNNMPYGVTYQNPQLTNEEAWEVAAFVNSQPRPHKDQHNDWKKLDKKPIDFPFAPYIDTFSERQHKFGPFKPIEDFQRTHTNQTEVHP